MKLLASRTTSHGLPWPPLTSLDLAPISPRSRPDLAPIWQSVANTLKRALLIWLSVLYFGNPVTWMSAFGTFVCIGGVFAYNHARRKYPYQDGPLLPTTAAAADPRDTRETYECVSQTELLPACSGASVGGATAGGSTPTERSSRLSNGHDTSS